MSIVKREAITRTVTVSDITPTELASIFSQYNHEEQAEFFDACAAEAEDWPIGWTGQALWVVPELTPRGRRVLEDFAEYLGDAQ